MSEHATPGQFIAALLEQRGWSQRTLAIVLGKDESTINKMVAGRGAVTTETALALEDVFDVPADRFLELQRKYDLQVARIANKPDRSRATRAALFGDLPVGTMIKRGWLPAEDQYDLKAVEAGLLTFFGANSLDEIEVLPHAAKKTQVNTEATPSQLAWLYRVRTIAEELMVPRFSQDRLDEAIGLLRAVRSAPEEARRVPRILSDAGVRFVAVETLPSAKIDGVCFWLDDTSPVVGLSLRYDRFDNFCFVLRHELEHVRLGHGKAAMILDTELEGDRAGTGEHISAEEQQANGAAQNFCVPSAQMDAFFARKAPFFSERDLLAFAKILGVHPGLVAGQLQHKTGRYDRFRQYLTGIRQYLLTGSVAADGWGNPYPLGA